MCGFGLCVTKCVLLLIHTRMHKSASSSTCMLLKHSTDASTHIHAHILVLITYTVTLFLRAPLSWQIFKFMQLLQAFCLLLLERLKEQHHYLPTGTTFYIQENTSKQTKTLHLVALKLLLMVLFIIQSLHTILLLNGKHNN